MDLLLQSVFHIVVHFDSVDLFENWTQNMIHAVLIFIYTWAGSTAVLSAADAAGSVAAERSCSHNDTVFPDFTQRGSRIFGKYQFK